jgi:beta-lactamase regulating signal transducer with metallopeptidase domain
MTMATIENLLSQGVVERLGWTLIHFVWQATVVAMLLVAALRLLRRCSANCRYVAGCVALALMVALPVATVSFVAVSGPMAEVAPAQTDLPVADTPPAAKIAEVAERPPLSLDDARPLAAAPRRTVSWYEKLVLALEPGLPYVVGGWLLGVLGLSAWHLGGWAQLQRLKRRMVCEVAAELASKLRVLAQRVGARRAVGLLESALVEVPTVVGWVKPVILLPAGALTGLSVEQLEAILAHELAHIRRYDYLVNMLQTVVEILGFYHPAVWWVSRQIRIERENGCDDIAACVCGDKVRYARALTCLEETRFRGADLAVAATGGSLMVRVGRLLGRPAVSERRFAWLPGLVALFLVAGSVVPAALTLSAGRGQNSTAVVKEKNETCRNGEAAVIATEASGPLERHRFTHADEAGRADRELSFETLQEHGDQWEVSKPFMKLFLTEFTCSVTADSARVSLDAASGSPKPGDVAFSGNIVVHMIPSEPDKANECFIYLDNMTFDAGKSRLSCSGPFRLVFGNTELAGTNLKLLRDQKHNRLQLAGEFAFPLLPQDANDVDSAKPGVPKSGLVTGVFVDEPLPSVLVEIGRQTNVEVDVDETVKEDRVAIKFDAAPVDEAIRRVLEGTPYTFRRTADAYLVYKPITLTLEGEPLMETLQMLSEAAAIPIIVDSDVRGTCYATIEAISLRTALDIILAGTPYVAKQTADYWLVTKRKPDNNLRRQEGSRRRSDPAGLIVARREYVNMDPVTQELAKHIAEAERELIVLRQTLAGENPEVIRKQELVDALTERLAARRTDLEREFDEQLAADAQPAQEPPPAHIETSDAGEVKDVVHVEARFLKVNEALLRGVGLDPNLPEQRDLAEKLSEVMARGDNLGASLFDASQVGLLLDAVREDELSHVLGAPHVMARSGEPITLCLASQVPCIRGFHDANDPEHDPVPEYEDVDVGLMFDVTPELQGRQESVLLDMEATISSVVGYEHRLHDGWLSYQVPVISRVVITTQAMVPLGRTALIRGPKITSFGAPEPDEDTAAAPVLILIKAEKVAADSQPTVSTP